MSPLLFNIFMTMTTLHLFFIFKWWKLRLFLKWPINIKEKLKAQQKKSELRFLSLIFVHHLIVCLELIPIRWYNRTCKEWYWGELVIGESERRDTFTIIFWIGRWCIRHKCLHLWIPCLSLASFKLSERSNTTAVLQCPCTNKGLKMWIMQLRRLVGIYNRLVTKSIVS